MKYIKFLKRLLKLFFYYCKSKNIVNIWHINNPNGMLYYAIDYINANKNLNNCETLILIKKKKCEIVLKKNLSESNIYILKVPIYIYSLLFLILIFKTYFFKTNVFTPSLHPLPFLRNQTVVIHDSFPFSGNNYSSRLKVILLYILINFSRTKIAFINNFDSLSFAKKLQKSSFFYKTELIYLPNKVNKIVIEKKRERVLGQSLIIGLPGTDSYKKNYDELMKNISKYKIENIEFIVFGFKNSYINEIINKSKFKIKVLDSSSFNVCDFLSSIDYLVNVSFDEGFCRPIAYAVSAGIPVLSVDTPVLREFYDGTNTTFFYNCDELVNHIKPKAD